MMKRIKMIEHPELESGYRLKPLEMNAVRLGRKHTLLTPEVLEKASGILKP